MDVKKRILFVERDDGLLSILRSYPLCFIIVYGLSNYEILKRCDKQNHSAEKIIYT